MIIKKKKHNNNENNNNNVTEANNNPATPVMPETSEVQHEPQQVKPDIDSIADAQERAERRRGDRRRGYRRIEDRSLVSRAYEEAKMIKDQASKDGFQAGIVQANKEISSLQEAIASLMNVKQEAYSFYQKDIIDIALEVAEKILNAQVDVNPETVVEIAKNVIKEISQEENKITFIINPADELILSQNLENNQAFQNKRASMSVQRNEQVPKGSCKVITNSGQIDATFSSQLSIIKKAFQEGM